MKNRFNATGARENFTQYSNSWDESNYATSLSKYLQEYDLPQHFIVDQGRVALPGARKEWGEWCNVSPAGLGHLPTSETNSTVVDAIVWIKPGGESDGACGMTGAPNAGAWFEKYIELLIKNANPPIAPTYAKSRRY